ncbi:MAG: hypothetical protein F6K26_55085 [Moorea sp. SIO2I5]|nr:hypothetical protein [Moorena sp. SIO2I5]
MKFETNQLSKKRQTLSPCNCIKTQANINKLGGISELRPRAKCPPLLRVQLNTHNQDDCSGDAFALEVEQLTKIQDFPVCSCISFHYPFA